MPVHVQAKNPFDYENKKHVNALAVKASIDKTGVDQIKKGDWNRIEDRTTLKAIKDLGHDSVYVNESGVKNLGVFQPNQIKSATGNRGTYDINDPHMNHAEGGAVEEYRGEHTAPGPTSGAPLHDVAKDVYPKDFYGPQGFRYYADLGNDYDQANYQKIKNAKDNPEHMVWAHRAVPTDVYKKALKHESPLKQLIRPGDWVTLAKEYAKDHGESALKGDYKIASMRVPAKHLYTSGDSLHEWGYQPTPVTNKAKGGVVSRETIKPVAHGIIKERVTVSPNLDAMQYELLSAKHFTKKVK